MTKLLTLLLLALALAACTGQLGAIDLSEGNNGQTITAAANQTVQVQLNSNITTGYKWNLVTEPDAKVVKFISSKYNPPIAGGIGAGGSEIWEFQTVGRGTTAFTLGYFRPFDAKQVAREFSVTITVQ